MALSHCIESASAGDPLVLQALQSMNKDIPLPFRSHLSNWQVEAGILTYQGQVYVPNDDSLHHTILQCCHDHETTGHPSYLKTCQLVTAEFWWPSLASYVRKYVEAVQPANKTKPIPILPSPRSPPFTLLPPAPFNRSPVTLSLTFPLLLVSIPFWSWSTMGLLRG